MASGKLLLVVSTAATTYLSPLVSGKLMLASRCSRSRMMEVLLHLLCLGRIVVHIFVIALLLHPHRPPLLPRVVPF